MKAAGREKKPQEKAGGIAGEVQDRPAPRRRGRPTAAMKERLDKEILETALRVFSEQGYGSATVQQICTSAGISLATFYRHYSGKDDIFRVVMNRFNEEAAGVVSPIEHMSLEDGLLHLAQSYLETMRHSSSPEAIRLVYAEAPRFPDIARQFLNGTKNWLRMLMTFLRRDDPKLSHEEAYDLSVLFMDMVGARHQHAVLLRVGELDQAYMQRHAQLVVRIFLRGISGHG